MFMNKPILDRSLLARHIDIEDLDDTLLMLEECVHQIDNMVKGHLPATTSTRQKLLKLIENTDILYTKYLDFDNYDLGKTEYINLIKAYIIYKRVELSKKRNPKLYMQSKITFNHSSDIVGTRKDFRRDQQNIYPALNKTTS